MNQSSTKKLLRTIGFESSLNQGNLILSYDKSLTPLYFARMIFIKLAAEKAEEMFGTSPAQGTRFPFFQKYSEVLGADLTAKTAKNER